MKERRPVLKYDPVVVLPAIPLLPAMGYFILEKFRAGQISVNVDPFVSKPLALSLG